VLILHSVGDKFMPIERWCDDANGQKPKYSEKMVTVRIYPSQIHHGLYWN
jgi:hypothetical protein